MNAAPIFASFRLSSLGSRLAARRGISLIEMVVVMASLTTLMMLIAATLWGAVKIERVDSATFHRMTAQAALADQFREDVGRAVECTDSLKEYHAGPTCLILTLAGDHHVVYCWADDRLKRTEFSGEEESTTPLAVGGERVVVQFDRPSAGRLVTMHLVETRGRGESRRDWPLEISAALGGDRR